MNDQSTSDTNRSFAAPRVRFAMPFNVRCLSCDYHVAAGTKFNATKHQVGSYLGITIFQFRLRCSVCAATFTIQTDPQNLTYIVSGNCKLATDIDESSSAVGSNDDESSANVQPHADAEASTTLSHSDTSLSAATTTSNDGTQSTSSLDVPLLSLDEVLDAADDPSTWFVDDRQVYRVSIHRQADGSLVTRPINGHLLLFSAYTGVLQVLVVHSSSWNVERKLAQLAKIVACNLVRDHLAAMPPSARPARVVFMRQTSAQIASGSLARLAVQVAGLGANACVQLVSACRHHGIVSTTNAATEHMVHSWQLYDDWASAHGLSRRACWRRLVLLLRADSAPTLRVALDRVRAEVNRRNHPDAADSNWLFGSLIWPDITPGEWERLERVLEAEQDHRTDVIE